MMALIEVGVGGLVGAPTRFVVDQVVNSKTRGTFPWGTLVVNAVGSFILGFVNGLMTYHGLGQAPSNLVGAGFCGALTTFSTLSYETLRLLEEGTPVRAASNVAGSLVVGLLSAGAGMAVGSVA